MGVDVMFKARPLNTDQFDQSDRFDRVRARFRARFPGSNLDGHTVEHPLPALTTGGR